jgi:hypothetical protein
MLYYTADIGRQVAFKEMALWLVTVQWAGKGASGGGLALEPLITAAPS